MFSISLIFLAFQCIFFGTIHNKIVDVDVVWLITNYVKLQLNK